eukprot:scaffold280233_cov35-Tisochrysis_lutea.AAC.1
MTGRERGHKYLIRRAAEPCLKSGVAAWRASWPCTLTQDSEFFSHPLKSTAHELVRVLLPTETESARNVRKRSSNVARRIRGTMRPKSRGSTHQFLEATTQTEGSRPCGPYLALGGMLSALKISVEGRGVHQALQDGVHEACVAEWLVVVDQGIAGLLVLEHTALQPPYANAAALRHCRVKVREGARRHTPTPALPFSLLLMLEKQGFWVGGPSHLTSFKLAVR